MIIRYLDHYDLHLSMLVYVLQELPKILSFKLCRPLTPESNDVKLKLSKARKNCQTVNGTNNISHSA